MLFHWEYLSELIIDIMFWHYRSDSMNKTEIEKEIYLLIIFHAQ